MIHQLFQAFKELSVASRAVLAAASCLLVDLFLAWEQYCYDYGGEWASDCSPLAPGRGGVVGVVLVLTTVVLIVREAAPIVRGEHAARFMREATAILGAEIVEKAPRILARIRLSLFVVGLVVLKAMLVVRHHNESSLGDGPWHQAFTTKAWLGLLSASVIAFAAARRTRSPDEPTTALGGLNLRRNA